MYILNVEDNYNACNFFGPSTRLITQPLPITFIYVQKFFLKYSLKTNKVHGWRFGSLHRMRIILGLAQNKMKATLAKGHRKFLLLIRSRSNLQFLSSGSTIYHYNITDSSLRVISIIRIRKKAIKIFDSFSHFTVGFKFFTLKCSR